jgi:hypothetical protein
LVWAKTLDERYNNAGTQRSSVFNLAFNATTNQLYFTGELIDVSNDIDLTSTNLIMPNINSAITKVDRYSILGNMDLNGNLLNANTFLGQTAGTLTDRSEFWLSANGNAYVSISNMQQGQAVYNPIYFGACKNNSYSFPAGLPGYWGATFAKYSPCSNPPVITSQPQDVIGCLGLPLSVSVGVSGATCKKYHWFQKDRPNSASGTPAWTVVSDSSVLYFPSFFSTSSDTGTYICTIEGECGSISSRIFTIGGPRTPVNLNVSDTPYDVTACTGSSYTLDFSNYTNNIAGTGPLTYQWKKGNTVISNTATATLNNLSLSNSGLYMGIVSNYCNADTLFINLTVNQTPSVTATPASGSFCTGSSVTINTPNAANTNYGWLDNNFNFIQTGSQYTFTNGLAGTYYFFAQSNGCTDTSAAIVITENPIPNVTVNSPTICSGQTATLTASGANSYTWTGGLSGNPATTPVLSNTTTYTVTGTSNGCSKTAVATVTVNPSPNVTVNSPTICAGQTATLTASGANSYTWTGGLSGNPATTPILNSTTTYTVTGTSGSCSKTAVATVTVTPLPNVTVNSPTICAGQTATLTASGASSYTWTGGLSGNPATTPALSNTTTYTVTGTSSGCSKTAVATVTVNPIPNVTVNSPTICAGQTATLTASGATSYTWTGGLSGNPATTPLLNSTTTYTVTGTTGSCSKTAIATVTVNPSPNVTVNSPTICAGQTATLTAGGATSYTWTGGLSGNPATTPVLNSTTTYTVTGTTGSCSKTAIATVTVNPSPNVTVNSPTICAGQTATLTAGGATTYTWTGGLSGNPATTPVLTGTTTYTVTGTTGSCSKTAVATVTVTPLPNVTVNSPGICTGGTATLTASGANTYTWTGGLSGNPATTPVLNTTTTYTVTGTTGACSKTAVATVTVAPSLIVTVNSPTICSGQSATLTAGGATTYSWTGGLSGNPATTPALSGTTTYTVTGTSGGCSGTAIATVTVNPTPNVTVNSATICAGQTATLTAGGATTYTWTGGLSGNPATTPVLTGTTTYTVTGTTGSCSKTAVATVTVTPLPNVTVNSPGICTGGTATLTASGANTYTWTGGLSGNPVTTPVLNTTTTYTVTGTTGACSKTAVATVTVAPSLTITVNSPTICSGQTATLTAGGATTYSWTGGLSGNPATTPALSGTTTYTVTGTSGGCSGTAIATVTVNPTPNVTVNSPSICAGQTATLTAGGATTYTWTGGLSGNPATTPILTGSTTYTVTGTSSGCSKTAVATVTVNPTPNVTVNSPAICAGQTATLSASGASSYTWTGGLSGNPANTPILTGSTTYTVTGTSSGCSKTAVATVTVNPTPATPVITQSNDTLYCSTVVIGATYEWYKAGVLQITTSVPSYKITSSGVYTVKVISNNCPSTISSNFNAALTAVSVNRLDISFTVTPNPNIGEFEMKIYSAKNKNYSLSIYNLSGQVILKEDVSLRSGNNSKRINLNGIEKGVYLLSITGEEGYAVQNIIIQ